MSATETSIVRRTAGGELAVQEFTRQQINVIKQTIMPRATDVELMAFVEYARRSGLDPFSRQIHAIPKRDAQGRPAGYDFYTGIDGLRLIASRTGEYEGSEVEWCGPDGQWTSVWLDDKAAPSAARARVFRSGQAGRWVVVRWKEFARIGRNGSPIGNWATMPVFMLGKVAESQALRRSFPKETAGLRVDVDDDGELAPRAITDPDAPASQRQKGELMRLARAFGWEDDERHERAGVESFTALTKGQAHTLIDTWRDWETALLEDGDAPPPMNDIIEGEIVEQGSDSEDEPATGKGRERPSEPEHHSGAAQGPAPSAKPSSAAPEPRSGADPGDPHGTATAEPGDPVAPEHLSDERGTSETHLTEPAPSDRSHPPHAFEPDPEKPDAGCVVCGFAEEWPGHHAGQGRLGT